MKKEWNQRGEDFDFPEFSGVPRSYVIASTPRSGSHYLGHLLFGTGQLGSPLEYLHPFHLKHWKATLGAASTADALRLLLKRRTSPSGWFGLKAHWNQFRTVLDDPEALAVLSPIKFIRIVRKDLVDQAISLVIAKQTKAWISFHDKQSDPQYDFYAIKKAMAKLKNHNDKWDSYLNGEGVAAMRVDYDELVAAPQAVVSGVCEYLGVELREPTGEAPLPERQGGTLNASWKEQFEMSLQHAQELEPPRA